jgi:DNA topoisomerase-2
VQTKEEMRRIIDSQHPIDPPGSMGYLDPKDDEDTMARREITYNPGFLKLFDEVITNSVDHSKRPEGKHLDTIKVEIDRSTGIISVYDNGGIPVEHLAEYDEYVPSLVFGYLRSGSNFDDNEDSEGAGQNGEGASLTNIFSTKFTVETCDGKKRFKQTWTKNMMEKTKPSIVEVDSKGYTRVTYTPDYEHLGVTLDDDNYAKLVKRVWDIAGCNSRLKIYLNDERIVIKSFGDYVAMYGQDYEIDETDKWTVAVTHSDDGFQHISFVNSTETIQGGTHVYYVWSQIVDHLRTYIKKKHKIEVKPTEISQHLRVFINATIVNPRYDSQTKETLMTEVREYKTSWKPSEKFIAKIIKSDIITRVLESAAAKERMLEERELAKMNKTSDKFNLRKIVKLQDAQLAEKKPERCILFLTEGDSAAAAGKSTGDRDTMGFLSLRGVPLNIANADVARITANVEFFNIMAAMGLKIGVKVTSIKQLRYSMLGIMTDADHDGAGHITGLLISNLHRFWPELFCAPLNVIHRFVTPAVKVTLKGKTKRVIPFYEEIDFKRWAQENKDEKFTFKYYKGLATSGNDEFAEYLKNINEHLIQVRIEDKSDSDIIELVFGKQDGAADRRKVWLNLTEQLDSSAADGDPIDRELDLV